eukprot:454322-Prymnesium_polylepis.2
MLCALDSHALCARVRAATRQLVTSEPNDAGNVETLSLGAGDFVVFATGQRNGAWQLPHLADGAPPCLARARPNHARTWRGATHPAHQPIQPISPSAH